MSTSNITSEYDIQLNIKDNTKDAIRALEKGLSEVGSYAKKAGSKLDITESLNESQKAADAMIEKFHEMAKNSELDFDAISKAYSKNAKKAISDLERQYAGIKDQLDEVQKEYDKNAAAIAYQNECLKDGTLSIERRKAIQLIINDLEEQQRKSNIEQLKAQVDKNRHIRASLKAAELSEKLERTNAKYKKHNAKLEELQAKRSAARDDSEIKRFDKKIKKQEALVKAIEKAEVAQKACEKTQKAVTKAIQNSEKAQSRFNRFGEKARNALQAAYNISGLAGGVGRLAAGGMRIATSGLNMVSQASDKALERERAANRVKGMDSEKASSMLGDIYVKTGADYSTIVDAINRVRSVMGDASDEELAQAAAIEVRYPGMSQAFASTKTQASMQNMNAYANRMKAIQKASGATDEQIQASTQAFANRKDVIATGGNVSEYQAVYLAMQNSGAFETEEELEHVFSQFVRKQRASQKGVFEFAKDFKMADYVQNARNKLQAQAADQSMDWASLQKAAETDNSASPEQTTAEKNAERMRTLEERKNQMMIKLIEVVDPIVNELGKLLDNERIVKIVNGLIKFLTDVAPILADLIGKVVDILGKVFDVIQSLWERIDESLGVSEKVSNFFGFANGGVTSMPSIVGERGPEAIIPLDYSRAQRADNIATSITQTFNMGSGATTALSLAQAVRSRDFTRAMAENAYISKRCGVF